MVLGDTEFRILDARLLCVNRDINIWTRHTKKDQML